MEPVSPMVDEPNLAVCAFKASIGEFRFDGSEYSFEMLSEP